MNLSRTPTSNRNFDSLLGPIVRVTLVLVVVPFVALAFFAHPSTDDFSFAKESSLSGFYKTQVFLFTELGGRYFGQCVIGLYGVLADYFGGFFGAYKFVPWLCFATLLFSVYFLIKSLTHQAVSSRKAIWGAIALFAIYLMYVPSTSQGFYWASGASMYTLGSILPVLVLAVLFRSPDFRSLLGKRSYGLGCCLLTFAAAGTMEIIALPLLAISLVGTVVTARTRSRNASLWRLVFETCLIGTIIAVLAPGNYVRAVAQNYHHRYEVWRTMHYTIRGVAACLFSWSLNPALLGATLLTIPIAAAEAPKIPILAKIQSRHLIGFIILFLGSIGLVYAPLCWATGKYPIPCRIQNITYLWFLLCWFAGVFMFVSVYLKRAGQVPAVPNYLLQGAKLILILSLLTQGNFFQAVKDAVRYGPAFHAQLLRREQAIRQAVAKGKQHLVVLELKHPPHTIYKGTAYPDNFTYEGDITTDPEDWTNKYYAHFWGIESIVITNVPEAAIDRNEKAGSQEAP